MSVQFRQALEDQAPIPEGNFLHVIHILVLTPYPVKALQVKSIIERNVASLAPSEELSILRVERQHPFIGKFCKIRSDLAMDDQKSKTDDQKGNFGLVVYSICSLAEARENFEGMIPFIFLEEDQSSFCRMVGEFLLPLKERVNYLDSQLKKFESEISRIAHASVPCVTDDMREKFKPFIQPSSSPHEQDEQDEQDEQFDSQGLLGEIQDATFPYYLDLLEKTYAVLKEQTLTLLLPRIRLGSFQVIIDSEDGESKIIHDASTKTIDLPQGANVLYALFYYFPELFGDREIKEIKVVRLDCIGDFTDLRSTKYLTLNEGDEVTLVFGPRQSYQTASLIRFNRQFSQKQLYPKKLGASPNHSNPASSAG